MPKQELDKLFGVGARLARRLQQVGKLPPAAKRQVIQLIDALNEQETLKPQVGI